MTIEEAIITLTNTASLLRDGTRYMKPEHEKQFREAYEMTIKALEQPERKKVEWFHLGGDKWCCPACGFVISTEGSWEHPLETGNNFCKNCGADMRGEEYEKNE